MKKLFITGVIAVMAFSSVAKAELEITGNVTAMAAYQHDNSNATCSSFGGCAVGGVPGAGGITQGDLRWVPTNSADHFGFLVDQAEIDVENEFGENIMARIDLDFVDIGTPGTSGPPGAAGSVFFLEQAYVTANIAIGNGMEFLIGKFNAPIGLESVDRYENVFSTYTPGWIYLSPTQVMGAKIYYEFSDTWNMDFAVVNSLNNTNFGNSAYPSGILRFGANWGDEDRQSFFHIAGGVGPEQSLAVTGSSSNKKMDYLGSLWGNFAIGDYWDVGWEGYFRMTDSALNGVTDQKAFAGQLYAVYRPSDVWTVQLRGAAFLELNTASGGASTTGTNWQGFKGQTYSGTLGATYQITDGAQMKLEYRLDFANTSSIGGASVPNSNFHTGVAEFAYSF